MSKETRTFIYGFFLIALGFYLVVCGLEKEGGFYKWFQIVVGSFNIFYGVDNIEKTTL
jgi:hypothetical protein